MTFPIRIRLTFWYVTLLLVSFLALGGVFSYSLYTIFLTRVDTQITSVANMMPHTIINPRGELFLPGNFDIILDRFFGIRTAGNYIQVLDPHGKVVSRSASLKGFSLPLTRAAYSNALKGVSTYEVVKKVGRFPVRMVTKPVTLKKRGVVAIVQVGSSLEMMEEIFYSLFYIFVFGAVASVIVAGGVGWFLARKALRPVSEITAMARNIGATNLNERIDVDTPGDEIGMLADTINEMISRLEGSFMQIKQFTGDASHELKTPLTILRGEMEIALRSREGTENMRRAIESALEEIDRMNYIVRNLLDLTKIEAESEAASMERVSLNTVLTERFEHFRRLAIDRGVELRILKNAEAAVYGDPVRISQLFYNLIDNAIKYTLRGGRVEISLERSGTEAVVRVTDTGVGISGEDLPYIFDRFYRVDKARTREVGGAGLGLSICKEIVETYGGSIRADSEPGRGTTFIVRLPLINND
ncbi:MAG: sensor histidine kinase [Thermodesulfobacteriota bacterium]